MLYRNISEQTLGIERATGAISISPGEEVAASPIVAAPYIELGQLELVTPISEPEPKASRRDRSATASTTSNSETDN